MTSQASHQSPTLAGLADAVGARHGPGRSSSERVGGGCRFGDPSGPCPAAAGSTRSRTHTRFAAAQAAFAPPARDYGAPRTSRGPELCGLAFARKATNATPSGGWCCCPPGRRAVRRGAGRQHRSGTGIRSEGRERVWRVNRYPRGPRLPIDCRPRTGACGRSCILREGRVKSVCISGIWQANL